MDRLGTPCDQVAVGHDWRHVAWGASGIAAVPILGAVNPTPGANIGIEVEIMSTRTAIETHTIVPQTVLRQQHCAFN